MRVTVVRIWLPATIAVVGVALIVFGGDVAQGAGIVLVGVAALVVEQEEERRQFFSRRGRWPNGRSR
jgi:hypothetical protein